MTKSQKNLAILIDLVKTLRKHGVRIYCANDLQNWIHKQDMEEDGWPFIAAVEAVDAGVDKV